MSCLHYEHEAYLQARKRFPREGQTLATSRGEETVVAWNLFRETVTLKDEHGERRTVPLEELKREARGRPGGPGRAGRTERA
jgi:cell fate regulator YaaT (PSP1 superfamily)